MTFDFDSYIHAFNTVDGNEEELVANYFTDDMRLDGPDGSHDRDAWIAILKHAHQGVRETLTPRAVVCEGDKIMAEVDATFAASVDRPDFTVKPLVAGETATARFFAAYDIVDGKISRIALAWWPAGIGS
jgi:hypothetical protein